MKTKIIFLFAAIALVFVFSQKVNATAKNEESRTKTQFQHFFDKGGDCIPNGVRVYSVTIVSGHMIIDVSPNILDYGGAYFEIEMIKKISLQAKKTRGVDRVTLKIDGNIEYLTEGSLFFELDIS